MKRIALAALVLALASCDAPRAVLTAGPRWCGTDPAEAGWVLYVSGSASGVVPVAPSPDPIERPEALALALGWLPRSIELHPATPGVTWWVPVTFDEAGDPVPTGTAWDQHTRACARDLPRTPGA